METEIKSPTLIVKINSLGAEIYSVKNKGGTEFIWQANKDMWARHAPVLFPIVGKLKDNFFSYNGKKYELLQHGFARDLEFELIDKKENACTFQLKANHETKKAFPFDFDFQICYQLEENTLQTNYRVINPSGETIYCSVGAHPGFNCPLLPTESFEDYYLEFERNDLSLTKLNNGLLSDAKKELKINNKRLQLTKTLFDEDALVFEGNQINTISLCSTRSDQKITLQCKNWPYFGIWTKKGNANFICLEPWYGIADPDNTTQELGKKRGIIQLPPGKEFNCAFSLIFS